MAAGSSRVPVIGIDLGTTYSCVAVWRCERVEIIPNEQGNRTTPSFVSFTDKDQYLIGDGAKNLVAMNPTNTVFDAKRLIGRRYDDARVQGDMKVWPFKIVEGKNNKPMIVVTHKGDEKKFTAEDISSMVLTKLKEIANAYLNTNVTSAVITVPAYFDDLQRKATKDAANVAGLNVLRLLNEPTAAAIAYELQQNATINGEVNILIFDLGGGTFDVSVVALDKGKFHVKAVGGDTHLGGEDFDNRLVEHFVNEFKRKYRKDVSKNPKSLGRLKVASEKAKRILSSTARTSIEIDCLYDGIDFSSTITRAKFEELNKDFFEKCMEMVKKCLDDAKLEKFKVDEVVLVGGSTRILKVQRMLTEFFNGKDLCKKINPDEAVAYGAAVLAENITSNRNQKTKGLILSDVTPLSLGVEINGEFVHVIIEKNTRIPVTRGRNFYTVADNQSTFLFKVYQWEKKRSKDNILLGEFELTDIPLARRGAANVRVSFDIDGNGILKVSAKEPITGRTNRIEIRNSEESLQMMDFEKMLDDADENKVDDQDFVYDLDAYKALENYIGDIKTKMMNDEIKRSLSEADLKDMDEVVEMVMSWLEMNKAAKTEDIKYVTKEVKRVCNSILGRFILE